MNDESKRAGDNISKSKRRLNRQRHALKVCKQNTEHQRAVNDSIKTLLSVVQYLNAVQDGDALRIEGTYSRTDIDKPAQILNCHEEDIMNASLITMKRLIETLLPSPNRTVQRDRPELEPEPDAVARD